MALDTASDAQTCGVSYDPSGGTRPMARTMAEAAIVGGPTIASTRDYRTLHLGSAGRADRTSSLLGAGIPRAT
jgi:hypothetical protein